MPVDNRYDRINDAFERAVTKLQDNLQYLADNDKVSRKFIVSHNLILKALIDYQQKTERYISHLEMEIFHLTNGKIREIEKLKAVQLSFEAICIIHGIMDFPAWMAKGTNYLFNEAIEMKKENMMQLPYQFLKMVEEILTPEEKETLEKILYRRMKEVQEEKIKRLMAELKINLELFDTIKNA